MEQNYQFFLFTKIHESMFGFDSDPYDYQFERLCKLYDEWLRYDWSLEFVNMGTYQSITDFLNLVQQGNYLHLLKD